MESCYTVSGEVIHLAVKASPMASKSALGEIKDGRLKVRIAAAPEDNKANDELRAFLAKLLGRPKKDVVLTAGEKSRLKTIALPLAAKETLDALLEEMNSE